MSPRRNLLDQLRDSTGIGYEGLTHTFDPALTRKVATWPVLAVFPMGGDGETGRADRLIASLLRRDLSLPGALSVLGLEDTPRSTFHELFAELRDSTEPLRWNAVAGAGCVLAGGQLVLQGHLVRVDHVDAPERFTIQGPPEQLGELTAQLAERFARALGLTPDERTLEAWRMGRPPSWPALLACVRAWGEDDVAWLERELARGGVHPDALVIADIDRGDPALVRRAVARACELDPFNPQLCFQHFCNVWKGEGRDSAAARALVRGLRVAPGHGKSQMCMAHVITRVPRNGERILAHAEAGYRLLRGNSFAMANLMNYLRMFSRADSRQESLVAEMLSTDPYHPDVLTNAMDFYISVGQPERALELALRFKELCTEPVHPATLYCFRQNPKVAAELESGKFKPMEQALRCVKICEDAVRRSKTS